MEKHYCIVLRASAYRDNDKMLALFSREAGRIDALARGVRKMGSKNAAAAQPLSTGEYEFNKSGSRLYLAGAVVKQEFTAIQGDYDSFAAACVILEVTERVLGVTGEYRRLFLMLAHALYAVEQQSVDPHVALAYYLVQALETLGMLPAFLKDAGGVISRAGAHAQSREELETNVEVLRRIHPKSIEAASALPVDFTVLCRVLIKYLEEQLHTKFRSAQSLGKEV